MANCLGNGYSEEEKAKIDVEQKCRSLFSPVDIGQLNHYREVRRDMVFKRCWVNIWNFKSKIAEGLVLRRADSTLSSDLERSSKLKPKNSELMCGLMVLTNVPKHRFNSNGKFIIC